MSAPTVIERALHTTPFGIRLVDAVTGRTEFADIDVRLIGDPRQGPITAVPTPSGVFAAHYLPGFRHWELPPVDDAGEPVVPVVTQRPFRIEVRDRSGRFYSFAVDGVLLPARGIVSLVLDSPPASPYTPLFSRPAREVPAATAALRARLEYADGTPAVHHTLEVAPAPNLPVARGLADERGELLVLFPYPEPPGFAGSPPAGSRRPLRETRWTVSYETFAPRRPSPPEGDQLPQLATFLDQEPVEFTVLGSPPTVRGEHTVVYGRETHLPTLLVGA